MIEDEELAVVALLKSQESLGGGDGTTPNISYSLLSRWTDGFSEANKLGEGGFGVVYMGIVPGGVGILAVKKMSEDLQIAALRREVEVLQKYRHPNLVRLYAFSMPNTTAERGTDGLGLCLVYEFARRGGLDTHLVEKEKAAQMSWQRRLHVALGVANALSYLHHSDLGGHCLHRDVKSANIVLTLEWTPKLIDCGLAKFIPSDPTVFTAHNTKVGQMFGTQGYQCPTYLQSGVYTVKSEIYSLGVVFGELLLGQKQGSRGVFIDRDSIEDGGGTLGHCDPRAGDWPAKLVFDWNALVASCLARPSKRPDSILEVLRALRELEKSHTPATSSASGQDALSKVQRQLDYVRTDKALGGSRQRPVEEDKSLRRLCASCGDESSANLGIDCGNQGHFLCADCFPGFASHQFDMLEAFRKNHCSIVCEYCAVGSGGGGVKWAAYPERQMIALLGDDSYQAYFSAKARVAEKIVAERIERETSERIHQELEAARTTAGRVLIHRKEIEGTILSTQCPGCHGSILDFAGCFALTCEQTAYGGCGTHFCAFCLAACGPSSAEAHAHVAYCSENPRRGFKDAVFCKTREFQWRNRARMQNALGVYLATRVAPADRPEVVEVVRSHVVERGLDVPIVGAGAETAARENAEADRGALRARLGLGGGEGNLAPIPSPVLPRQKLVPNKVRVGETVDLQLCGHTRTVRALAVLPNGRVASSSSDKSLRIWSVHGDEAFCELLLQGHSETVCALAVLRDGRLVSASDDTTMRIWRFGGGGAEGGGAGGQRGEVEAECEVVVEGHPEPVTALMVTADGTVFSGCKDGAIRSWSVVHGRSSLQRELVFRAHDDAITALAAFPDGRRFVSAAADGTVRVWSSSKKDQKPNCFVVLGTESDGEASSWGAPVNALVVLPDNRRFITGPLDSRDSALLVWIVTEENREASCQFRLEGHTAPVRAVTVMTQGRIASCSNDHTIRIWELLKKEPTCDVVIPIFHGWRNATAHALAFLPDGRICSGADDNLLRVALPTNEGRGGSASSAKCVVN